MAIILREDKGAPLTIGELDQNFLQLHKRLSYLETNPMMAEGIGQIQQNGDRLEIMGTQGTHFGSFVLPKVFPKIRGAWSVGVDYDMNDWVVVGNLVYLCCVPHKSADFDAELRQGKWGLVQN